MADVRLFALDPEISPPPGFVDLFVDPADNHFKQRDSSGLVLDLTEGGSGSTTWLGLTDTASNFPTPGFVSTVNATSDKLELIAAAVAWGAITGTLSAQADLQGELNAKGKLAGGNSWTAAQSWVYTGTNTPPYVFNTVGSSLGSQPAVEIIMPVTGDQKAFQARSGSDTFAWASFERSFGAGSAPGFSLGAGGGSARDVTLYRSGANILKTDDKFEALTTVIFGAASYNDVGDFVNAPESFASVQFVNDNIGTGDVVGPVSSTDEAISRFNGTTGKIIQNSTAAFIDDTGQMFLGAGTAKGSTNNFLNFLVGNTQVKGIFFHESTTFHMGLSYDGSGVGISNKIVITDNNDVELLGFRNDPAAPIRFANPYTGANAQDVVDRAFVLAQAGGDSVDIQQVINMADAGGGTNFPTGNPVLNAIQITVGKTYNEFEILVSTNASAGNLNMAIYQEDIANAGDFLLLEEGNVFIANGLTDTILTVPLDAPLALTPGRYYVAYLQPTSGPANATLASNNNGGQNELVAFNGQPSSVAFFPLVITFASTTGSVYWTILKV